MTSPPSELSAKEKKLTSRVVPVPIVPFGYSALGRVTLALHCSTTLRSRSWRAIISSTSELSAQLRKLVSSGFLPLLFGYSALDGVTLPPSKGRIECFDSRENRVARISDRATWLVIPVAGGLDPAAEPLAKVGALNGLELAPSRGRIERFGRREKRVARMLGWSGPAGRTTRA